MPLAHNYRGVGALGEPVAKLPAPSRILALVVGVRMNSFTCCVTTDLVSTAALTDNRLHRSGLPTHPHHHCHNQTSVVCSLNACRMVQRVLGVCLSKHVAGLFLLRLCPPVPCCDVHTAHLSAASRALLFARFRP